MKLFITGDRSLHPVYTPLAAIEMLRAVAEGRKIATGDQGGVEQIIREFGEFSGIEIEVVPTNAAGDKPTADEWDARHTALAEAEVEVVVIHSDPHASSVYKSLTRTTSDDAVRLVTPLDLFAG